MKVFMAFVFGWLFHVMAFQYASDNIVIRYMHTGILEQNKIERIVFWTPNFIKREWKK
jgi:hypothetical protein